MEATKHLDMLGKKIEDKVTGFKGVVTSVSFDLYGCVQALVHPGMQQDGNLSTQNWFDIARLKELDAEPVMQRPNYIEGLIAQGKQGAADKPAFNKA